MNNLTQEQFLPEVKDHVLTVLKEDGVYRHLRFGRPESSICSFNIVTWPGHLCYSGDMGTFVFHRLHDMFEFFRSRSGKLEINPSYWSEKVEARDRDGITQYEPEIFTRRVREHVAEYIRYERDKSESNYESNLKDNNARLQRLILEVREDVLTHSEFEVEARHAADDFEFEGRLVFQDFWETDLHDFTHRFIWCCYALVWGIKQYDARMKS